MHIHAHDLDARQGGGMGIGLARMDKGNPELRLGLAGVDLGVGLGVHIGIDPQRDGRALAHRQGDFVQRRQFRLALDIELMDARVQRGAHLGFGLAHAGKDDLAGGNARRQRLGQFAARHHIGARAQLRQCFENRQIVVGLDRVGDQRARRQRAREHLEMTLQRGGGIAIKGRADGARQFVQPHLLGAEHAIAVLEVVDHL